MRRTKVCFVATYAWALFAEQLRYREKTPFGGSEIQLYQLAKELTSDKNFEVSFIVGDFGQKSPLFYEGIKVYKGFRPTSWVAATPHSLWLKYLWASVKLWLTLWYRPMDIYIQRAAGGETGIIALFCKLFRRKFIYMIAHQWDVSGEYARKNGLRGRVFEWGLKKADLVITQNIDQMKLLGTRYHKPAWLMKSVYPIEDPCPIERDYILWVGRGETWKKPELFLELALQFPQKRFIMVCQPAVYYGAVFERIKTQAQGIHNLSFIEYVPFTEIDQYFNEAQVLVNTSEYEGFPNAFIQAAKNKTPLLSFKVNPDNFINQYQCGFCADGNFDQMVEKLKALLENEALHNKMGENAFRYAKQYHDINKIVPKFKELLQSLVIGSQVPNEED